MARAALVLATVAILLTTVVSLLIVVSAYWISAPPLDVALRTPPPGQALRFGTDTLAFANENRTIYRGKPDLYPNWCFVMARAVIQFQRFARFDPGAPRVTADEYTERVRRVTARAPWRTPLPPGERVVIPGYASLNEFSRAEERAVKAGFHGRFLSWIHWTNWRVAFPMLRAQQEGVASIHVSAWPQADEALIDPQAERAGEALLTLTAGVRRWKSARKLGPGAEISQLMIAAADEGLLAALRTAETDLRSVTRAREIGFVAGSGDGLEELAPGLWINVEA